MADDINPVPHENRIEAFTCRFVDCSGGLLFVDEAAEDRSSLDPPAGEVDGWGGDRRVGVRRPLPKAFGRQGPSPDSQDREHGEVSPESEALRDTPRPNNRSAARLAGQHPTLFSCGTGQQVVGEVESAHHGPDFFQQRAPMVVEAAMLLKRVIEGFDLDYPVHVDDLQETMVI
jgi:hypothetical protein